MSNRLVGPGQRVLVIAEIGVNHDGSLKRALELVREAARAGADAVKLQIFQAHNLVADAGAVATYQRQRCGATNAVEMLRGYELSADDLKRIVIAIREEGMLPLATPFSPADVAVIRELEVPAVKIASPDLVNRLLLKRAAELGRPLLVSTGAATVAEVAAAVTWLREWDTAFALLHCVSSYPTRSWDANLSWIGELISRFGVPVGFSDHTTDVLSGALAVAAGACFVERHLTYDRGAEGPDHAASSDPRQFNEYVRLIRRCELMRGSVPKRVLDCEQEVRRLSRQSLVLQTDLDPGAVLREEHLTVQRPGNGILPADLPRAIGRRVKQPLHKGQMLDWNMLT